MGDGTDGLVPRVTFFGIVAAAFVRFRVGPFLPWTTALALLARGLSRLDLACAALALRRVRFPRVAILTRPSTHQVGAPRASAVACSGTRSSPL
jgi:hypothetical protein